MHPIIQNAGLAAVLASLVAALIGPYVVARRITYIAGGISHAMLAGIGAAVYLAAAHGITWLTPFGGALVVALFCALLVGQLGHRPGVREDALVSVLWVGGMALGVILMNVTPGYARDLSAYLFGNILLVSSSELLSMGLLTSVIVLLVGAFHRSFVAVSFDPEFARTRSVSPTQINSLLLLLIAVAVVLLSWAVGIILVIALLTLPAMTAGLFSRTLTGTMLGSFLVSGLAMGGGIALGYVLDLPAGAVIVLLSVALYLICSVLRRRR